MNNDKLKNKIKSWIDTDSYNFNDMSIYIKAKKIIGIIESNSEGITKNTDDIKLSLPPGAKKENVIKNYNTALMVELTLFTWGCVVGSDIDIQKFYNSLVRHCKLIESLREGDNEF